jgi:hypothetical protein
LAGRQAHHRPEACRRRRAHITAAACHLAAKRHKRTAASDVVAVFERQVRLDQCINPAAIG